MIGNEMNDPIPQKWASVYFNSDFYVVVSNSGYRGCALDPSGYEGHFSPTATDGELGNAVLEAISRSRFLKVEEIGDFFNLEKTTSNYSNWVASLLERYKYKSRRALFKDMTLCNIEVISQEMEISPTRHEKLEGWGGLGNDGAEKVRIAADSSAAEVGRALRIAFSRCE
jgi:hypothetical protein